ncbi:mitochondria protoheme IX farnesyltransferase [Choiromyces venosus 120613-1]|uniref:Protoheme IX farnesyltransferase, mitochondrial n=1 Tax=Choiromyces venosus 120613-1 TaxID=1336337 RepID=A0A3N4J5N2_9PEZI|nr:mitochondria protoheme IX farnesyltransferase [Choiromyces venosus 120613-1]
MRLLLPRTLPPPTICSRCLRRLITITTTTTTTTTRRLFSSTLHRRYSSIDAVSLHTPSPLPRAPPKWQSQYFHSNGHLRADTADSEHTHPQDGATISTSEPALLPHRRRQLQQKLRNKKTPSPITSPTDTTQLPPDASSLLSTTSSQQTISWKRALYSYLALTKPRLTALIVLSAMAPYALFPVDPLLSDVPTLSALTLTFLTLGTALSSSSANALNMYLEPAYDRQMSRTRNRPLVRGLLTPRQALIFAVLTGALGVGSLYIGVNPTVAALGGINIVLYAGVYTPLKRISVVNTWVGAVVGGIPPLMGWAAAAGNVQGVESSWLSTLSHPGGWLLAGLLFAWQFPHFNSLSWGIKDEYRRAGYQMMVWKYPALNARVSLRYSLLFFPICVGLWAAGVTDVGFLADSSVVNGWLVREAWRFYRKGGEGGNAKRLFWASVWHLPVVMGLAMVHKAGLWRGVWESIVGGTEAEEEYDE